MPPDRERQCETFFDANALRRQLIEVSVFLAGFEMLKTSVVGRLQSFYSNTAGIVSGELKWEVSPEYRQCVLSRDKSEQCASLLWLKEAEAITDEDISAYERVRKCRNRLAHDLMHLLLEEGLPSDFEKCVVDMANLIHKVEKWWIINVDIATDPDFDGKDVIEDGIMPGPSLLLQVLRDIALEGK